MEEEPDLGEHNFGDRQEINKPGLICRGKMSDIECFSKENRLILLPTESSLEISAVY